MVSITPLHPPGAVVSFLGLQELQFLHTRSAVKVRAVMVYWDPRHDVAAVQTRSLVIVGATT